MKTNSTDSKDFFYLTGDEFFVAVDFLRRPMPEGDGMAYAAILRFTNLETQQQFSFETSYWYDNPFIRVFEFYSFLSDKFSLAEAISSVFDYESGEMVGRFSFEDGIVRELDLKEQETKPQETSIETPVEKKETSNTESKVVYAKFGKKDSNNTQPPSAA